MKVLKHELIPFSSRLKTDILIPLWVRPFHRLLVLRARQVLEYLAQNYLLLFKLHLHSHGSLLYFLIKKSLVAADVSFLTQRTSCVLLPFRTPVLLSLWFPRIRRSSARMKWLKRKYNQVTLRWYLLLIVLFGFPLFLLCLKVKRKNIVRFPPRLRKSSARMKLTIGAGIKRMDNQDIGSVPKPLWASFPCLLRHAWLQVLSRTKLLHLRYLHPVHSTLLVLRHRHLRKVS